MASKSIVAVVTADMMSSRRYGKKARTELDRAIRQSFSPRQLPGSLRRFKVAASGFHITVGDEFQFVSKNLDLVLPFITHLRARLATHDRAQTPVPGCHWNRHRRSGPLGQCV